MLWQSGASQFRLLDSAKQVIQIQRDKCHPTFSLMTDKEDSTHFSQRSLSCLCCLEQVRQIRNKTAKGEREKIKFCLTCKVLEPIFIFL